MVNRLSVVTKKLTAVNRYPALRETKILTVKISFEAVFDVKNIDVKRAVLELAVTSSRYGCIAGPQNFFRARFRQIGLDGARFNVRFFPVGFRKK